MIGASVTRLLLLSLIPLLGLPTAGAAETTPWDAIPSSLAAGEVVVLSPAGSRRDAAETARREGLLVVDLSDEWAPFLFSDSEGTRGATKPNAYRQTFVALANDRVTPDQLFLESDAGRAALLSTVPAALRSAKPNELSPDEQRALDRARRGPLARAAPNYLEVYGIPPTLSVLARRVAADSAASCYSSLDLEGLRALDFEIDYQTREQAQQEYAHAVEDSAWVAERLAALGLDPAAPDASAAAAKLAAADPQVDLARLDRYRHGQVRLRAVRAAQQRLVCEGLLASGRFTEATFDHATHVALAEFERKNDVFGWGFVGGATREALLRPPFELHFDTLRRILAERVADAAAIVEDGSASKGGSAATYVDGAGEVRPVPNLIEEFVDALLHELRVETPHEMADFLRAITRDGTTQLRVAFRPPPLPPYYGNVMDLSAEIDRGDVWYDSPFDPAGKLAEQRRLRFPHFTLFVAWRGQKIPLVRWRTTIGSWRSELGKDGHIYLKYKNSDVGPRVWKDIVAAPVWVPPASTPGRDLLVKKTFDRRQGPISVVNTEVIGPGFASAYGLVMAIHLKKLDGGGGLDNQIRTHGSVDYTSIARRYSHGCHRLVNNRAVRLFGFVLKHRPHARLGNRALSGLRRRFTHEGRTYEYRLSTRGYYYELRPAMPVMVLEGRILGRAAAPIERYVRKPGVAYGPLPADSPVEAQPVPGP
jgi:hypothetical protein